MMITREATFTVRKHLTPLHTSKFCSPGFSFSQKYINNNPTKNKMQNNSQESYVLKGKEDNLPEEKNFKFGYFEFDNAMQDKTAASRRLYNQIEQFLEENLESKDNLTTLMFAVGEQIQNAYAHRNLKLSPVILASVDVINGNYARIDITNAGKLKDLDTVIAQTNSINDRVSAAKLILSRQQKREENLSGAKLGFATMGYFADRVEYHYINGTTTIRIGKQFNNFN